MISILALLFFIIPLNASFKLDSKTSAISVKPGATLNFSDQLNNYDGTIVKEAGGIISGNLVGFRNGVLEDQGNEVRLTATLDPSGSISLLGSDTLTGNGGPILQTTSIVGLNNRIEGVANFRENITLLDLNAGVTLALDSSLNTSVILNNGTLRLDSDLRFGDEATISGSGIINVNSNNLTFGGADLSFSDSLVWNNAADIFLSGRVTLASSFTFNGISCINGNGNIIDFDSGGGIYVGPGGTLSIADVTLKDLGVMANPVGLLDDVAELRLSNVTLEFDDTVTFTIGGIVVEGPTTFALDDTDVVFDQDASMTIDGTTLWIDPLDKILGGNITFGTPESNHLSLVSNGTIKRLANWDLISTDTSTIEAQITSITGTLATITTTLVTIIATITGAPQKLNVDANNISGVYTLSFNNGLNFTVNPITSLFLTISAASCLLGHTESTEIKSTDTVQIRGRDNVIEITETLTFNGALYFENNSELTFEFNDRGLNPTLCLSTNVTLSPNSRMAFKGRGNVVLVDGTNITFSGDTFNTELSFEDGVFVTLGNADKDAIPDPSVTVSINGVGTLNIIDGSSLIVEGSRHLVLGDTIDDNLNIVIDNAGLLAVRDEDGLISMHKSRFNIDVEQAGAISVATDGILELNALDGVPSPGRISNIVFEDHGILSLEEDGTLIIGDNLPDTAFNWNSSGGIILEDPNLSSNGEVQLLSAPGFSGVIPSKSFSLTGVTDLELVSELLQRSTLQRGVNGQSRPASLTKSVLFIDSNEVKKLRLANGQIAILDDGDLVIKDDPETCFVYGVNEGTFIVKPGTPGSDGPFIIR